MPTDNRNVAFAAHRRAVRRRQIRRRRLAALAVPVALGLLVSTGAAVLAQGRPGGAAPAPSPAQTLWLSCDSPSLGGALPALVYLPSGYRTSSRPYPVVYFLHGLPANPTSYQYDRFIAKALAGARTPAIVVTPQGARTPDSDPEYLDAAGQNWPQAISHDLVSCIDHRYRTIARRRGRALVGLSAGGYGAFNIGMRMISTFAALESWSGYFEATDPDGTKVLDLGSEVANAAARAPRDPGMKAWLARFPTYLAFYVGAQDTRFLKDNWSYHAALSASGIRHVFRVYPGGHTGALWRAQAASWLGNALAYLAAAER